MKKKVAVYSILLAAAVGLWLFTHSERAKIARMFDVVAKIAAKERSEPVVESAVKSRSLANRFKDGCSVYDRERRLKTSCSREDVAGAMLAFRSDARTVAVEFLDLEIAVDGSEARVEGVIDCTGTDSTWPAKYVPKAEKFIARLEKIDGEWLFAEITVP